MLKSYRKGSKVPTSLPITTNELPKMSNQFPSASQIRAAMAMLKWENKELHEASGVSEKTAYSVKTGHSRPQPAVLAAIRKALEDSGIEFTEQDGVRRRSESVQVLQGPGDFRAFYDIVYEHLKQHGGTICVSGVDEKLFAKYQGDQHQLHIERMNKLTEERDDIQVEILIREGDTNFTATSYASYRWQSRDSFSPTAFYVFGDYLALISFQSENAPKVILIRSAVFAEGYRRQFAEEWDRAKIPPQKKLS
jgi:hypothetical protein